jgi:hypothetical protein
MYKSSLPLTFVEVFISNTLVFFTVMCNAELGAVHFHLGAPLVVGASVLTATVTMKAVKGIPSTKKSVFTTLPPALNFSVWSVSYAQPACASLLSAVLHRARLPVAYSSMPTAQAPRLS